MSSFCLIVHTVLGCNAVLGYENEYTVAGDSGLSDAADAGDSRADQQEMPVQDSAVDQEDTSSASDSTSCTPADKQCSGLVPQICNADGQWEAGEECAENCEDGVCGGPCAPTEQQCSGLIPQTCNSSGYWESGAKCSYLCTMGNCTGSASRERASARGLRHEPAMPAVSGWTGTHVLTYATAGYVVACVCQIAKIVLGPRPEPAIPMDNGRRARPAAALAKRDRACRRVAWDWLPPAAPTTTRIAALRPLFLEERSIGATIRGTPRR